jgi:glycosyltransferase involved in cell wall biosynthesis
VRGAQTLHFVHPGPARQLSGGTVYDLRVIDLLRNDGWQIDLHELPGRFPLADETAKSAASDLLRKLPDGATVVFDGLALPAFSEALADHEARLIPVALVHHPTADETGLSPDESARLFEVETRLFACMHRFIVPSPAMVRRLKDFGVDADRVCVAEPGVEPAPRARGSGSETVALLCVASLTPRKGHLALLDALADCRDLDWRVTCAGPLDLDPATAAAVGNAIDRLALSDRVRLIGPQKGASLEALYDSADIFVLASRYEGYGIVFAEAMARGLPIVASGDGAVADTVPESAGIVVPVDDRGKLTAALRSMIADPDLRRAKAEGAWSAGRSLPRWTDTAARFSEAVLAANGG